MIDTSGNKIPERLPERLNVLIFTSPSIAICGAKRTAHFCRYGGVGNNADRRQPCLVTNL
jgi:hypothetical protein